MKRYLLAAVLAVFATLGCFYFMTTLVKAPDGPSANSATPLTDPPAQVTPPEPPKPKPETEPKQKFSQSPMPGVQSLVPEPAETANVTQGDPQAPMSKLAPVTLQFDPMDAGQGQDREATPVVQLPPQYPVEALRDGREGWVKLRFTVTAAGTVDDIQVIDAEPKRLFDKAARDALRKWRYQPLVVDGKALAQPGQEVQLDFKMDKSA